MGIQSQVAIDNWWQIGPPVAQIEKKGGEKMKPSIKSDTNNLGRRAVTGDFRSKGPRNIVTFRRMATSLVTFLSVGLFIHLMVPTFASAQLLGTPHIEGNGCPEGTVSAALSPDARVISIFFDEFRLENIAGTPPIQPKNCFIRVPVNLPPKTTLGVYSVDFRGFVDIQSNSSALFEAFTFMLGNNVTTGWTPHRLQLDARTQNFFAPMSEPFTIVGGSGSPVWIKCGATNLVLQIALKLGMIPRGQSGLLVLDTADGRFDSGVKYKVEMRSCP
jgi:hypothetical protein